LIALVLVLLGAPAPADLPAPADAPADAAAATPLPLVLDVAGIPVDEMKEALALRLRDRSLLLPDEFSQDDHVDYAAVRRNDDGSLAITLITADGRAYDRALPAEQVQGTRAVAGVLANLVYAMEAGETAPDRTEVPIPAPKPAEPPPEPKPEPAPKPKLAPTPEPKPSPPPPRWELGLAASGGVIVGVAPQTSSDALSAGAGALALDLRSPKGALVGLGVRVGGRIADPLALLRTRIDLGAGYGFRWKHAELALMGAMSVELWRTREDGDLVELEVEGNDTDRPPLLGGFARISPGWYRAGKRPGAPGLRLGARVDIGGSAAVTRGGHTIDIGVERPDGTRDGVLHLGGLELAVGLELALWFGL
jgi:hypothetical protein